MAVHGAIGAWDEYKARQFLEAHGVPVVPGKLAQDADEAVEAAELLGYPVVAKVVSKDILHKSDIGGVLLNLTSPAEVRSVYASITAAAHQAVPEARVEGILISPMRGGGIELLAGVVQDPNYGPVLAVGLGGIFVEVFKDASLHVLPASRQDIKEMIDRLSGRALLDGIRGGEPSSIENIVEAVHSIASLALRLGDQLESLEVNPLLVRGDRVEALDAVLTWNQIED
jgi:succinyl-CoA synthetase beta subunit